MLLIFFGFLLIFCNATLHTNEFLYPIAAYKDYDNNDKVLVMYQKSLHHVELWSWDPTTQRATKILLSSFSPAGVRLLPDGSGFSFIDNGRIRIKEFIKRSPKSIEIDEPLHDIGLVSWADNGIGYFSAKNRATYNIFSLTTTGDCTCCATTPHADCMYPSCVGTTLFYIERIHSPQDHLFFLPQSQGAEDAYCYRIVQQPADFPVEGSLKQIIMQYDDRPLICLTMISESEGFVVEHAPHINKYDTTIVFLYHHFVKTDEGIWKNNYLFSFSLPAQLLLPTSDIRLHESILPLLPRLVGRTLYYVDLDVNANLIPYKYEIDSDQKLKVNSNQFTGYSFVPFILGFTLFYGGQLIEQDNFVGSHMYLNAQEDLCFSFPSMLVPFKP